LRCNGQIIGILAAASFCALIGSASYAATAEEALEDCKNFPDARTPVTCEAYFEEIMNYIGSSDPMSNPKGPLCLDEHLSPADVIPLVIDWIENHPDDRSISLFDATHNALSPRFKCK
jgi:hypothetical protein